MNILGISCYYHDAAAALLQEGSLIAAAEEERFSRIKHDPDFPVHAIEFCLKKGGISAEGLDYVVFYEKPFLKFERILLSSLSSFPKSSKTFSKAMGVWLTKKLWIKQTIKDHLCLSDKQILFSEHPLSHAASAFYASPFKEAAILTLDGVGEWATATAGKGNSQWEGPGENRIHLSQEIRFPHSVGLFYSVFTAFLGFEVNEGEYKVMGMAPYGTPKYVDKVWKTVRVDSLGGVELDLDYYSFQFHSRRPFSRKFVDLFGEPRDPKERFMTKDSPIFDDPVPATHEEIRRSQYFADVASSVQQVTEEILLTMTKVLYEKTKMKNLCMAGGVALNSKANARILKEVPFESIYIQPSPGDSGGAIGAALWAYHEVMGNPRKLIMDQVFYGASFTPEEVEKKLEEENIPFIKFGHENQITDRVVDHLQNGKVVGWFQGSAEFGPRALGHRSILADPRNPKMKDTVNIKIKFREAFRPFAPSVLVEEAEKYFDLENPKDQIPARFMLYIVRVLESKRTMLPAITHADGSARLQTVFSDTNPLYYELIAKFGQATDIPVLLNTSFNLRGEPIVNSPGDALNTFFKSGLDVLVIENCIVEKKNE